MISVCPHSSRSVPPRQPASSSSFPSTSTSTSTSPAAAPSTSALVSANDRTLSLEAALDFESVHTPLSSRMHHSISYSLCVRVKLVPSKGNTVAHLPGFCWRRVFCIDSLFGVSSSQIIELNRITIVMHRIVEARNYSV